MGRRRALLGGRLPAEYQEVEWIGSDGTPYLDLGFAPSTDRDYSYEIVFQTDYSGQYSGVFGSFASGTKTTTRMIVGNTTGTSFLLYLGSIGNGGNRATAVVNSVLDKFKITMSNTEYTLYDYTVGTETSGALDEKPLGDDNPNNFLLFGYINTSIKPSKFWSAKVWHSDTLIRDMIPCYRKSDSVIGMYDRANNVLYTNAASSGTFTAGNPVY